jgi:hypothetical protein
LQLNHVVSFDGIGGLDWLALQLVSDILSTMIAASICCWLMRRSFFREHQAAGPPCCAFGPPRAATGPLQLAVVGTWGLGPGHWLPHALHPSRPARPGARVASKFESKSRRRILYLVSCVLCLCFVCSCLLSLVYGCFLNPQSQSPVPSPHQPVVLKAPPPPPISRTTTAPKAESQY